MASDASSLKGPSHEYTTQKLDPVKGARSRIEDDKVRHWFANVLRAKTRDQQEQSQDRIAELNRQLSSLRSQQDRLLNLRLMEEIDESTFAAKNSELRDRIRQIGVQIEGCDRNRAEQAEIAMKAFELSQTLKEKWLIADVRAKRRLLEIVCLNFSLEGATLVPEIRKPFDVLAEGLLVSSSRGDWRQFEPSEQIVSPFARLFRLESHPDLMIADAMIPSFSLGS